MRKFLIGSLLAATFGGGAVSAGVVLASPAFATGPTTQCNTSLPSTPLGTTSVLAPSGASTSGELQVCESGSPVIDGTATAEGSGGSSGVNGYAVANGDPGTNATGYVGVEGGAGPSGGSANVVGCSSGDYNNGTNSNTDGTNGTSAPGPNDGVTDSNGNNVIVGSGGNTLSSVASGPCSVTNEAP
ncbi:MAG TPA: hypothetical protein VMR97_07580 [Acidimicrobiales bacterium]|nr:hypothetical protein [Acidimicrobiales bacterium]